MPGGENIFFWPYSSLGQSDYVAALALALALALVGPGGEVTGTRTCRTDALASGLT